MKNKSIWSLAILVIVFSFLSILVIKNQALAVWSNPSANPPSTISDTKFVFNPVTANLDLNNKNLNSGAKASFTEVCINNDCKIAWPDSSSDTGSLDWKINSSLGIGNEALYYTTTTGSGNVGIGTDTPITELNVYDISSGPIISLSGSNLKYRGISVRDTLDSNKEKWFYGAKDSGQNNFIIRQNDVADVLTIANDSGNVAIGTDLAPSSYSKLYVASGSSLNPVLYVENNKTGGVAIKGIASGYDGLYYSKGVEGVGKYAVYGKSNYSNGAGVVGVAIDTGTGVLGEVGSSAYGFAGYFKGNVKIVGYNSTKGFLQIVSIVDTPIVTDCDATAERGRMMYSHGTDKLYICGGVDGSVGWRSVAFTP